MKSKKIKKKIVGERLVKLPASVLVDVIDGVPRQWIPVAQLLPIIGEAVLVYLPASEGEPADFNVDIRHYDDVHEMETWAYFGEDGVTHWMPLPSAPAP